MKEITVAFRLDDPSAISPIEIERNLINIFGKHNVSCTFGVIPNVTSGNFRDHTSSGNLILPDDKVALYKKAVENNIIDIALHGYEHKTIYSDNKQHSEFRGLDKSKQIQKIKAGKDLLEEKLSANISSFIPPWNTYDENTIDALIENNISCISSNRYQPIGNSNNICFLPITIELPDINTAIEEARKSDDPEPIIVVLMHPYDFKESKDTRAKYDCDEVDKLLNSLCNQSDIKIKSISKLTENSEKFGISRYRWNKASFLENIYIPGMRQTDDSKLYLSTNIARNIKIRNSIKVFTFYISIILLGIITAYMLSEKILVENKILLNSIHYIMIIAAIALAIKVIRQKAIYFRTFFISNYLIGSLIGLAFV